MNMSASWKISSMVVLPLALSLAGVGCVAQGDEDAIDNETASVDEGASVSGAANEETATAESAFCGGYGGYPYGGGYPAYGGYGYGGYGGLYGGYYGGFPYGGAAFGLRRRFYGCGGW
ncbi:Hypothetical protein A7982_01090 [Minicystis rosea]|nr:Hypothetical protein A7982_01090 [Minicystis rosea]